MSTTIPLRGAAPPGPPGRRVRRPAAPFLAALLVLAGAAPAWAGYQGTVHVNDTAFDAACLGFEDGYPEKMHPAAVAAFKRLGYETTSFFGKPFTKDTVLKRVATDWGVYVHTHGDRYAHSDGNRYSGFRVDAGICRGAPIVYSKEIATKRAGRQSNLVVMSTCALGDPDTTMPAAFAIAKDKALALEWNGPEFYLGYLGDAWDSDQWIFEQRFWDALADGQGVGAAFDLALGGGSFKHPFDADWWGSYYWSGRAGPGGTCSNCS
jgi:hypothetical protein